MLRADGGPRMPAVADEEGLGDRPTPRRPIDPAATATTPVRRLFTRNVRRSTRFTASPRHCVTL